MQMQKFTVIFIGVNRNQRRGRIQYVYSYGLCFAAKVGGGDDEIDESPDVSIDLLYTNRTSVE
jgi:hypothetical protein